MATQTLRSEASPARENPWLSYLSLFTSLGTLFCCALPSLLVLFGLGATVASSLRLCRGWWCWRGTRFGFLRCPGA